MSRMFIWTPKMMRQMVNHLTLFACFISYEKWVQREGCNLETRSRVVTLRALLMSWWCICHHKTCMNRPYMGEIVTCLVLVEQQPSFVPVQPLSLDLQWEWGAVSWILYPHLLRCGSSTCGGEVASVCEVCRCSPQNCIVWPPPHPERCSLERNTRFIEVTYQPRSRLVHTKFLNHCKRLYMKHLTSSITNFKLQV